jgi:hypothetical protein
MGMWEFRGKEGLHVVIESDDDVLEDVSVREALRMSLAQAYDVYSAEAPVMQRFEQTHEVDHGQPDWSLDQVPLLVTIRMRRRR